MLSGSPHDSPGAVTAAGLLVGQEKNAGDERSGPEQTEEDTGGDMQFAMMLEAGKQHNEQQGGRRNGETKVNTQHSLRISFFEKLLQHPWIHELRHHLEADERRQRQAEEDDVDATVQFHAACRQCQERGDQENGDRRDRDF